MSPLFEAVAARGAAAVLSEGIVSVLPRSLEVRPFAPALAQIVARIGMPAVQPGTHADLFARLLREEAARAGTRM